MKNHQSAFLVARRHIVYLIICLFYLKKKEFDHKLNVFLVLQEITHFILFA